MTFLIVMGIILSWIVTGVTIYRVGAKHLVLQALKKEIKSGSHPCYELSSIKRWYLPGAEMLTIVSILWPIGLPGLLLWKLLMKITPDAITAGEKFVKEYDEQCAELRRLREIAKEEGWV